MFYHLSLVATPSNAVMRTNDIDTLVSAMGCLSSFMTPQFYVTVKYISIDQACEKFGSSLRNTLPAFHNFTVWDYTVSFKRNGNLHLLSC